MKQATVNAASIDEASERLGVPADDVLFLGACGVLDRRRDGVSEASLARLEEEAGAACARGEALSGAVGRAVLALRAEWDRALIERGPTSPRRIFGAVHLGEHPDGTVVYAVEEALDKIVSRNLHVLGGGRVRQLIVDHSLMQRWGAPSDLLESIAYELIERVPAFLARRLRIVPVELRKDRLIVAVATPLGFIETDDLRFQLGVEVDFVIVPKNALDEAIARYYGPDVEDHLSVAMCELSVREPAEPASHDLERIADAPSGWEPPATKRPRIEIPDTNEPAPFGFAAPPPPPPPPAPPGYTSFDEAQAKLQVDEEELKKLVSTGTLRGFRDGSEVRFKSDDIANLRQERETEPTMAPERLDDFNIDDSSDELVLEDSRTDIVINVGDIMAAGGGKRAASEAGEQYTVSPCEVAPEAPMTFAEASSIAADMDPFGAPTADPFSSAGADESLETEAFELVEGGDDDYTGALEMGLAKTEAAPEPIRARMSATRRAGPAPATAPPPPPPAAMRPPTGAYFGAGAGAMPPQAAPMPPGMPMPSGSTVPMPVGAIRPHGMPMQMQAPVAPMTRSKAGGLLGAVGALAGGVASGIDELSKIAANPKPAPLKKEDDEPETFERKATVRYYSQMYARRNYPLLVVVSKRSIQKIVKQHVAQVEGKKAFTIRRGNPFVQIRPILPGCLCVPAEITLNVKPKVAEAKFWVTPTAEGELEEARVEVLYEGKVVSTIDVPTRVTTQALAKLTGSAAFLTTTAGPFFEAFGVSVKKESASLIADVLAHLAGGSFRYGVAGLLGFIALVFFLRRRPKAGPETEGFFDWGVEDVVEGDPLVKAVKAKLVVAGPEGLDVVDLIHSNTLIGSAQTAHVRVRGARSLAEVACELRYDDTFVLRARSAGIKVDGEDLRDGEERKLRRDAAIDLDGGRVTLGLLDLRQDPAIDGRRDAILEALVRARPSFESELRALWKRTANEPFRVALLEALQNGWTDPHGWRRVRASMSI